MSKVRGIPDKIVGYNVYDGNEKLLGISGQVTLPNLEAVSETLSGAGILGEIDSPNPGHFGPLTIEIPFRVFYDKNFALMAPGEKTLILRASKQSYDERAGKSVQRGLKITLRGTPMGVNLGNIETGKPTDSSNSFSIHYLKIEEAGKKLLELDKFNYIFVVDGIDVLKEIRNQI